MARPKAYERDVVLTAARDLFWERGYAATSISDLEQRTGLNRSSLYQEFGSKHDLFEAAVHCYADQVITALLADLRGPDASLETVVALFRRLGTLFRSQGRPATHGCLLVNATGELASRDQPMRAAAASYRDQVRASFAAALTHAAELNQIDAAVVQRRADLLASTLMGVWLTVRIDTKDASQLCDTIAAEVASWKTVRGRRARPTSTEIGRAPDGANRLNPSKRNCSAT